MLMGKTRTEQTGARRRRWGAATVVGLVAAVSGVSWSLRDRHQAAAADRAAREALAARRFDDARAAIEKSIARRPGAGEPYLLLARLELAQDHPGPALGAIERARALGHPAGPLDVL